ncbi:hypothetical protein IIB97_01920 [Patescibacteria group bacterium]|nr:hypothetical protein [Patescibacteria group bacterium]
MAALLPGLPAGKYTLRCRTIDASGIAQPMKIYEVQSSATGDGVYNCYEQTVDNVDWASTTEVDKVSDKNAISVEVWNALESYIYIPYAESLFLGDRMVAWESTDSSGVVRVVGVPVVPTIVRLAYVQENSPADDPPGTGSLISVKLGDYKGVASGDAFDAKCLIYGGSALDEAVPRLTNSSIVFVIQLWGIWYVVTPFIATEDCVCSV